MWRKLLFLPPVAIAALTVWWVVGARQPPATQPPAEEIRTVRVIQVEPQAFVPRVTGYGTVQPAKTWKAVVQVAGQITYVHPELKRGAILPAGTEIIRISPRDYELAIARAEASISRVDAELAEFDLTEANTRSDLAIESQSLEIRERELDRRKKLADSGNLSATALDEDTRETLVQRKKVQDLENTLKLIPSQRKALEQEKALNRFELEQAELNLERTRIALPFTARIAEVEAEISQFAQIGAILATADGIDTAEVEAQIPLAQFAQLARAAADTGAFPESVTPTGIREIIERFGFSVTIRLDAGETRVEWPGTFSRISDTIDLKTRSVGVIATASDTWRKARPGRQPPLTKGLFVEVELRATPLEDRLLVPRSALHDGMLYVADATDRLRIRPAETGFTQAGIAVVRKGLEPGERVVVSDLLPAVEGMRLQPLRDEILEARIASEAGNPTLETGQ